MAGPGTGTVSCPSCGRGHTAIAVDLPADDDSADIVKKAFEAEEPDQSDTPFMGSSPTRSLAATSSRSPTCSRPTPPSGFWQMRYRDLGSHPFAGFATHDLQHLGTSLDQVLARLRSHTAGASADMAS